MLSFDRAQGYPTFAGKVSCCHCCHCCCCLVKFANKGPHWHHHHGTTDGCTNPSPENCTPPHGRDKCGRFGVDSLFYFLLTTTTSTKGTTTTIFFLLFLQQRQEQSSWRMFVPVNGHVPGRFTVEPFLCPGFRGLSRICGRTRQSSHVQWYVLCGTLPACDGRYASSISSSTAAAIIWKYSHNTVFVFFDTHTYPYARTHAAQGFLCNLQVAAALYSGFLAW